MKLGIDFGTTNTAICKLDNHGRAEALAFGGAQLPISYIPSIYAVDTRENHEFHGVSARKHIGKSSSRWSVYQNFKMLLGETTDEIQHHWGNQPLQPEEVTKRFMLRLIEQIREEHRIDVRAVTVTVPEIWIRQNLHKKREHLINSIMSAGIPQVQIESEPSAAATYFLDCYRQKAGTPFTGHLLVCDCGGGTLDFCLLKVEEGADGKPIIEVKERAGNGEVGEHLGTAGVAFDQSVVNRLFPDLKKNNPIEFYRITRVFEDEKIRNVEDICRVLELYRNAPSFCVEPVFTIEQKDVFARDLAEPFEALIAPRIRQALETLTTCASKYEIDYSKPDNFRVIMVGGFSLFYLVQETVRTHFGSQTSADERFEDILTLQDRALAIAKGAALLANDMAEVFNTCPAEIGVVGWRMNKDNKLTEEYITILEKGVKIENYKKPTYSKAIFTIGNINQSLTLFVEAIPGNCINFSPGDLSLNDDIIPQGVSTGDEILVGFSLDEKMVFRLHVRKNTFWGDEKTIHLGHLMDKIPSLTTSSAS